MSSKMSMVSIVIPTYNGEKYLREAIDSALNQSYSNIEVIVVDDGSTDGTIDILKEYGDTIIPIWQENGHTGKALNTGIQAMHGTWFKELQADDRLLKYCVALMVGHAEELPQRVQNNTIFYGDVHYIDDMGLYRSHRVEPNHNDLSAFDFNTILLQHNIGNGTTVMIHRNALKKHGLFDTKTKHEDYEMRLRWCVLQGARMHLIPELVAEYRLHENNYTRVGMSLIDHIQEDYAIKMQTVAKLPKQMQDRYARAILKQSYHKEQHPQMYQNKPELSEMIRLNDLSCKLGMTNSW